MKIITWNINGYRSIVGQNPSKKYDVITKDNRFFSYVEKEKPDIICVQEIKAEPGQIDNDLLCPSGYQYFYYPCQTKKGYSGVATFSRLPALSYSSGFGNKIFDDEGRIIIAEFKNFIHLNIYFPKGYADNERLGYKLSFYDYLFANISKLKKKNPNIIISGDYNTAHKELDLARPKENIGTSGFMPQERLKLDELVNLGFVDVFRLFEQKGGYYSWWSQRGRAKENNIGWRIDYHFATQNMKNMFKSCFYQPDIDGSDHCPLVTEFVI